MMRHRVQSVLRVGLLLAPLSLALSACETIEKLNPFDDQAKKTPLSGDRRPVFPDGVPGVQYNAPPTQPSNSNIQVTPQEAQNPDSISSNTPAAATPQAPAAQNPSDDPWAQRR